jgi:UDP-N-acetylmuramoyl-tripeptide--D-alanyl-D-alanine ligase
VNFLIEEVLVATGGRLLQGERNRSFRGICTDSRTISEGELYFALQGLRFDGHHYALEALDKKAAGVVVEEEKAKDICWNGHRSKAIILVKDTLQALGDLARERRRRYQTPVVALTGSNGKTTSKEMIAACLEASFPVLKNRGNWNNLIGLPLTLLRLTERERVVVLEMGMNVPGEIRRLTEIAEPDVGLITNIQKVHLEGLGSLERLKEEKGDLFRGMKRDGTIVVNTDDFRVVALAKDFPGQKITFGIEEPSDVRATEIRLSGINGTSFTLVFEGEETEIVLPLLGRHFVPDALSAVAIAALFGIDLKRVKEVLEHFRSAPMRMEIVSLGNGKTLINDAYNANPESMEMALQTLAGVKGGGRAIAVLGDMLELGSFTEEAHLQLGRRVGELSMDFLLAIGDWAPMVVESAIRHGVEPERTRVLESHGEAISLLRRVVQEGDWVLIKGSRKMAMEKIVEGLTGGRG